MLDVGAATNLLLGVVEWLNLLLLALAFGSPGVVAQSTDAVPKASV